MFTRLMLLASLVLTTALSAEGTDVVSSLDATGANNGDQSQEGMGSGFFMLLIFGFLALMIFSTSRAQKKEQRKHKELVESINIGDQVITAGGVHGKILRKGEHTVDLSTGENGETVITFGLNAINKIVTEEDAQGDSK